VVTTGRDTDNTVKISGALTASLLMPA